jgi:hypothetical protein
MRRVVRKRRLLRGRVTRGVETRRRMIRGVEMRRRMARGLEMRRGVLRGRVRRRGGLRGLLEGDVPQARYPTVVAVYVLPPLLHSSLKKRFFLH